MIPVVRLVCTCLSGSKRLTFSSTQDPLTLKAYAPGALLFVLLLLLECSGRKGSFGMGSLIVTLWVGLVAVMFEGMLGPVSESVCLPVAHRQQKVNDLPESLLTAITQDLHPHLRKSTNEGVDDYNSNLAVLGGPSSHYYRKFMVSCLVTCAAPISNLYTISGGLLDVAAKRTSFV